MGIRAPEGRVTRAFRRHRWLHWAFVFSAPLLFFLCAKLTALASILHVFATSSERTLRNEIAGLVLGALQDLAITALLVAMLVVVELVGRWGATTRVLVVSTAVARSFGATVRFVVVLALVLATLAPFSADMLLLRSREMRFTFELLATYRREQSQAAALEIEPREVRLAIGTIVAVFVTALGFTGVYIRWVDLLHTLIQPGRANVDVDASSTSEEDLELAVGQQETVTNSSSSSEAALDAKKPQTIMLAKDAVHEPKALLVKHRHWYRSAGRNVIAALLAWIALVALASILSHVANPAIAAIGLNATLNELFRNLFGFEFQDGSGSGVIVSAAHYLQSDSETYELFKKDVLYRKTTGFEGPLAFDVSVDELDPPNVLVLAVESFRYLDSLLMASNTTAGTVLQKHNLTLTPEFDRWAQRGIAFPNMWSSWQTSRSLEAILFGQVAYDSISDSGTSGGQEDTKLSGMPQLFKQKGYETVFTTGCIVSYDQWDTFLPSHGFETVIAAPEMKTIAERDYGISSLDWDGPVRRGFYWGVHDDVSLDIIGDLLINKTQQQTDRVERGEQKQPFFLNHYTISSHGPFELYPAWLDSVALPDFSPLCEGWESQCTLIKKYAKLRYFTDMELGKFLDRMSKHGILNDTIVVIVGDHGQSPEMGLANPIQYQTAVTHVASTLIAEGRLGQHAGMVYSDATHHYDLLNTLADIVGVPEEGFLQTGIGRSLKRAVPFGERLVYSNNPMKKMSIVRGHERFVYDRTSSDMGLFNTIDDPLEKNDLLPTLSKEEAAKWREKIISGRMLNAYFKRRWDAKCLARVEC